MFDNELHFLDSCLKVNPKGYGSWQHRCWVMLNRPEADWNHELKLCNKFLEYDERNCEWRHILCDHFLRLLRNLSFRDLLYLERLLVRVRYIFYCFITSILISSLLGLPSLRGFAFEWRHTGRWTRFHFRENLRELLQLLVVALPQQTPTLCPSQPQHCDGCDWKRRPARVWVGAERVFYRPQRPECLVLSSLAPG